MFGLKEGNVDADWSSHMARRSNGRWRRDASGRQQSVPGWHLYGTYVPRDATCVPGSFFIEPSG